MGKFLHECLTVTASLLEDVLILCLFYYIIVVVVLNMYLNLDIIMCTPYFLIILYAQRWLFSRNIRWNKPRFVVVMFCAHQSQRVKKMWLKSDATTVLVFYSLYLHNIRYYMPRYVYANVIPTHKAVYYLRVICIPMPKYCTLSVYMRSTKLLYIILYASTY